MNGGWYKISDQYELNLHDKNDDMNDNDMNDDDMKETNDFSLDMKTKVVQHVPWINIKHLTYDI